MDLLFWWSYGKLEVKLDETGRTGKGILGFIWQLRLKRKQQLKCIRRNGTVALGKIRRTKDHVPQQEFYQ